MEATKLLVTNTISFNHKRTGFCGLVQNTCARCSHTVLSSSSTQAPLQGLKSSQMSPDWARNPFITLIMERMQAGVAQHQRALPSPSLYKPLKPTLTANERPVQSVSSPVPIWSRLPGASSAFVLWLCEGRARTLPQRSSGPLLNMHLWVAVKKKIPSS